MPCITERLENAQRATHDAFIAYQDAQQSGNNWREFKHRYDRLSREAYRLKQIQSGAWPDDTA